MEDTKKLENVERGALVVTEQAIIVAICFRCGESWQPKAQNINPKRCARCNSPYWNTPRKELGESRVNNKYGFDRLRVGEWLAFPWFLKPDGSPDWSANAARARSLEQFMRRHNYRYEFRNGTPSAPGLHIKRIT